jgi:hypothetical protein
MGMALPRDQRDPSKTNALFKSKREQFHRKLNKCEDGPGMGGEGPGTEAFRAVPETATLK